MFHPGCPKRTTKLRDEVARLVPVFVPGYRGLKIPLTGEPVRADRSQVRQSKRRAEVLAYITPRYPVRQFHAESHAARDHGDLERRDEHSSKLRHERKPALLRHDQQFAVGIVESACGHRPVRAIDVDATSALPMRIAIAPHRNEALDEIRRLTRNRYRIPTQLIRWRFDPGKIANDVAVVHASEGPVLGGRSNAIKPRAPIRRAGRCEGGTRYDFSDETVRAVLGRVLFGQGIRQRRCSELIAEAGLVLERVGTRAGRSELFGRSASVLRRIHYPAHDVLCSSFSADNTPRRI